MDVSRETPAIATRVFAGDRLNLATTYAEWLATAGVERGLIGPREVPRLWDRHIINCAMLGEAIPQDASVVDLGSGAGLPGLVLAIARPDLTLTLVEPLERRTIFLLEVIEALGLGRVEVIRGRAEASHGTRAFDVVTSRALAPLSRLLGWSMPLVSAHGVLLAMKGRSVEDEIVAARAELARWGCAAPEVVELGDSLVPLQGDVSALSTTRAVRVAHADPTRVALPGQARKKRSGKRGRQG